jgi:hypothetical protein
MPAAKIPGTENMITPAETSRYVAEHLPGAIGQSQRDGSMYHSLEALRDYACERAAAHDFQRLGDCLRTTEELHREGAESLKYAVENVVVYSISRMLNLAGNPRRVRELMPDTLLRLYNQQCMHGGY